MSLSHKISQRLMAIGLSASVAAGGGALIYEHEGLVLGTYVDPVGIVTSCFGHVSNDLKLNQQLSESHCLDQLATDLSGFDKKLQVLTPHLSDGEHAAYLSFMYNVGSNAFAGSTLRMKLLKGDRIGACNELSRWVYADKQKLNGLVKRREAERQVCIKGLDYELAKSVQR